MAPASTAKRHPGFSTGYAKVFTFVNAVFNKSLSLALIICASPLILLVALVVKLQDGGPILYRGVRLGFRQKPFTMYKFRTLVPGAQQKIGAELLTEKVASSAPLETPFGRFLRYTRLDELPQLFNIIRGDMDFLGPRPERPEIYEKFCKQIKGYDKRFAVRPGLIGYAQLFTPHSSPKRIRTIIDNKFLLKKQNLLWDMLIVSLTIGVVVVRVIQYGSRLLWNNVVRSRILGRYSEQRKFERVRIENAAVYLNPADGTVKPSYAAKLVDINEDAILIEGPRIDQTDFDLTMEVTIKSLHGRKNKRKLAYCHGTVYKRIKTDSELSPYATVIKYTPNSPFNYYMVHQYFLHKSII